MRPEFTTTDEERQVSPHAQEIEYALILQRMINAVKDDPKQMRLTIYEFARARLKLDTVTTEESERERLATALETAIRGVEEFLARREVQERLPPSHLQSQIGPRVEPAKVPSLVADHRTVTPAPEDILVPERIYPRPDMVYPLGEARTSTIVPTLARFGIGIVLLGLVATLAYYNHRLPSLGDNLGQLASTSTERAAGAVVPGAAPSAASPPNPKPAVSDPPFPIPSDYGVYAINNDNLNELYVLSERVPDKRIAVSTPIDRPSRTILPDGKTRFIVFRRDLIGNAPDRIEIRIVARVARVISFDTKGKPNISAISDAFNIRNISYEFRVRPIAGNPEMLLVQSDKPDFALPAGRYVMVLKDQGYDFTISGKVSEASQCLERTDAANGSFYSECPKP